MKNKVSKCIALWNTNELKEPFVSVCMLSYNHEKYIQQAIDSVFMQEVSFPVEIVLHDDASTDKTQDILKQYDQDNPGLFKLLLQKENQRSKLGGGMNPRFNYPRAKGKYIALLDGDDYWTDPLKLQKQVDFLKEHEEFSMCFTKANLLKNGKISRHPIPFNKDTFEGKDLLATNNFICTASVVFRAEILKNINNIDKYPFGDLALHLNASKAGKIKCLDDITTVYRIHDKGLWSKLNKQDELIKYLNFYKIYFTDATTEEKQIIKEKSYQKILNCKIKAPFIKQHLFKFNLLFKYSFTRTRSIKFVINITKIVTFRVLKKVYGGINKIQHNNTLL